MISWVHPDDHIVADASMQRELRIERTELLKHIFRILLRTSAILDGRFLTHGRKMMYEVLQDVAITNEGAARVKFVSRGARREETVVQTDMSVG